MNSSHYHFPFTLKTEGGSDVSKSKGLSHQCIEVDSRFDKGKFVGLVRLCSAFKTPNWLTWTKAWNILVFVFQAIVLKDNMQIIIIHKRWAYTDGLLLGIVQMEVNKRIFIVVFFVITKFAMWLLPRGFRYGVNYINVIKLK